jgi:BMFP domain-containing protein YqiC
MVSGWENGMQTDNKLLEDLARVANGAMGAITGVRGEAEALFKARLERLLSDLDLVTRDEFEAVKAVAAKAREEQEALELRVAALEKAFTTKPARKSQAKPTPSA